MDSIQPKDLSREELLLIWKALEDSLYLAESHIMSGRMLERINGLKELSEKIFDVIVQN